jgi:hypothetical protein
MPYGKQRAHTVSDLRKTYFEVGALCGHKAPEAFADFMLADPCAHHGNHWFDDEPCPEPCGRTHERCCACWCPLPRSECLILITEERA